MSNIYFEWDKEFETGNKAIDKQHYSLIETINELIKIDLYHDDEKKPEKVIDINQKLSKYASEHFRAEEKLMEKYFIDEMHTTEHKKLHKEFSDRIEWLAVNDAFLDNEKRAEIIEYLIRWMAYHILNMDKSLFRQIDLIKENNYTPSKAYSYEMQRIECATEPLLKALKALYLLVTEKNKELESKNLQLEEEVICRTKKLTKANKKLIKISLIDELTGLSNRRFAFQEIDRLMYNWSRYQVPFSLVYLDVDKFKQVNDNYGHEKGDLVLKWIAKFLKRTIRKTNIACRLGGDEFAVICVHCNIQDAKHIGENIIRGYQEEQSEEVFQFWNPSLSIGIATVDETINSVEDLLKKADSAMYNSKRNGGNQFTIADSSVM